MHDWEIETEPANAGWDRFVAAHPCGHFLQSSGWARLRIEGGWRLRRCIVRNASESGSLLAGAQVLIRSSAGGRLAYVPRGPVALPDDPAWPAVLAALREATRDCVALRLEPHWQDGTAVRQRLLAAGFIEAEPLQPPSTLRLDLDRGADQLLADMKQKWRYNVRLAARRDVTIHEEGISALPVLEQLIAQTAQRNVFGARPKGYYSRVWHELGADERCSLKLYVARYSGWPLAAIFVVEHGRSATYVYGGSDDRERKRMPNHALQWAAVQGAIDRGLGCYDLWGIPDAIGRAAAAGEAIDAIPEGSGGLWGVWRFKRGFGGEVWRSVGAWDLVYRPLRYRIGHALLPRLRQLKARGLRKVKG